MNQFDTLQNFNFLLDTHVIGIVRQLIKDYSPRRLATKTMPNLSTNEIDSMLVVLSFTRARLLQSLASTPEQATLFNHLFDALENGFKTMPTEITTKKQAQAYYAKLETSLSGLLKEVK